MAKQSSTFPLYSYKSTAITSLIRTNSPANKLDGIWLSSLVRSLSTVTKNTNI
jgi:hypothetical protein